jgi:hypothetical protein
VVSGFEIGVADRVRRVRRAAQDAVAASWIIGSEETDPAVPEARRLSRLDLPDPLHAMDGTVPDPVQVNGVRAGEPTG